MNNTVESPVGLFAIIDDDSQEIVMLYHFSGESDIKRADGKWKMLTVSDDELFEGGIQVAVSDSFISFFDQSEKSGKTLTRKNLDRFLRKLEK